jgi:hypothetical protein
MNEVDTRKLLLVLCVLIGVPIALIVYWIADMPAQFERDARSRMQKQIEDVRAGRHRFIFLSNETDDVSVDEFVNQVKQTPINREYELAIEYCNDTDEIVRSLAGVSRVQKITIAQSDVTAEGLKQLSALPDLRTVCLYRMPVRDLEVEALQACPKLESLEIAPWGGTGLSLATAIRLPHLKRLTIDDRSQSKWLSGEVDELQTTGGLEELTLIGGGLSSEQIDVLQAKFPSCKIVVKKVDK